MTKTTKNPKTIIQVTPDVRIISYDTLNVTVEKFMETTKRDGTVTKDWKFKGYASTIKSALRLIVHQEVLVDTTEVDNLDEAVQRIEDSNAQIMKFIESFEMPSVGGQE